MTFGETGPGRLLISGDVSLHWGASLLENLRGRADLRRLEGQELATLAGEIQEFLVTSVARTGGHLGPNLGVIELIMRCTECSTLRPMR